ncbi:hypothetical protein BK665_18360 [Pseudomonas frederiksbergensis]|uniref:Uncharacterized protein n=1 Tax=Pseudomonas frederiksbergensis TaxID=104087 RepID=A0A423KG97_9PSED|nr:hypothetical protein BK665_18360 [Pseudomonas frederiksbergensis]
MSCPLFIPGELEQIHTQVAQLRAETMRLSDQTSKATGESPFVPLVHFWQTMALAFCLVFTVGTITTVAIKYFL